MYKLCAMGWVTSGRLGQKACLVYCVTHDPSRVRRGGGNAPALRVPGFFVVEVVPSSI